MRQGRHIPWREAWQRIRSFFQWAGRRRIPRTVLGLLTLTGLLAAVAAVSESIFHVAVEGFTVIAAIIVHTLATRTYKYSGDYLLLFAGISFLHVAAFNAGHLLTSQEFGLFILAGTGVSDHLHLAGRYLEAISLFLLPSFAGRRFGRGLVTLIYTVITLLVFLVIFRADLPSGFTPNGKLAPIALFTGWGFNILLLGAILRLWLIRNELAADVRWFLISAAALAFFSNLVSTCFPHHATAWTFSHVFRAISYYLFFRAFVARGLEHPYETIFAELKTSATLDALTGTCNRQGWIEYAARELAAAKHEGRPVGILLMDIDNFKRVNDRYGHLAGDAVLRRVADILRASVRQTDIVCRLGGDEFAVIVRGGPEGVAFVQRRIREAMDKWIASDEIARDLGLSIGCAFLGHGNIDDIDALLAMADRRMYQEKANKKRGRR